MARARALLLLALAGCFASQRFVAVPEGLDLDATPHATVAITAQRYRFEPDEVRVPAGTLVTFEVTSLDTLHGFWLPAFGVRRTVDARATTEVDVYVPEPGRFRFHCSRFCGIGHVTMSGDLVVE